MAASIPLFEGVNFDEQTDAVTWESASRCPFDRHCHRADHQNTVVSKIAE
jgi:hypothetical protein